jgi:dual specificity phosphatase 12
MNNVTQPCSSYFVEYADWLRIPVDEEEMTQHGDINCPKCNEKVGAFAHYGKQCSCGCFVNPGY